MLAESFVKSLALSNAKKIKSIAPGALEALQNYDWPGNIRELKNILERMVVLSSGEELTADLVPEDIKSSQTVRGSMPPVPASENSNLSDMEKIYIQQALGAVKGNKSLAAKKLGISRRTLYRKIQEYGL